MTRYRELDAEKENTPRPSGEWEKERDEYAEKIAIGVNLTTIDTSTRRAVAGACAASADFGHSRGRADKEAEIKKTLEAQGVAMPSLARSGQD